VKFVLLESQMTFRLLNVIDFFFLRQGLPVVQVSLELKILLFLPPKSWDYRCVPQCLVNSIEFLNFYCYYFFGSGD
jgi:hypothetical protein